MIQTNDEHYSIISKNIALLKQLRFFKKRTVPKRLKTYGQVSGVVEKVASIFHMERQTVQAF